MKKSILKTINLCFIVIPLIFVISCGPSQKEYNELKKENKALKSEVEKLKKEIDELKYGAERLFTQGKNSYEKEKFKAAQNEFKKLLKRHPDAAESKEAKIYITKINKEIKRQKAIEEEKRIKEERERKRKLARATSKMRKKVDEIEGITWYQDRSTYQYASNKIYLYIGKKSYGNPWLRLKVMYYGSDWLFVDSFVVVGDGIRYDRPNVKFERDNSGGRVWEWYDESVTEDDRAMIRLIIASDKATVRFMGDKYHKDHIITKREKLALQNVIDAYEALKE